MRHTRARAQVLHTRTCGYAYACMYVRAWFVRPRVGARARRRLKIQPGRGMYHRGTYAENRLAQWGEEEGRSLAGSNQDLRFIIYNAQERARVRRRTLSFTSVSLSPSRTHRRVSSSPHRTLPGFFASCLSLSLSLLHVHISLFSGPPRPPHSHFTSLSLPLVRLLVRTRPLYRSPVFVRRCRGVLPRE